MAIYLGPYDVIAVDGKEYRRGDNINVSQARLEQLRTIEHYRFDGDEPLPAAPIMSNTPDVPPASTESAIAQRTPAKAATPDTGQ